MTEPSEGRYATPRLRRAAVLLLAQETAGAPATSETLAAASGHLLDTLSQRLADVIGPAGVHAVFLRAIRLQQSEFPFLDERIFHSDNRESLTEHLRACLQEHAPDLIRAASVMLFATVTGLLANVIGDRLTWSLLAQIWPDTVLPGSKPQETQE